MTSKRHDSRPVVIDLFCGAGGLTAGLESSGWHSVAAVDFDRDAIATLRATQAASIPVSPARNDRTYLDGTRIIHADIQEIVASDLRPPGASTRWRPDLLAGGPPCQPFSSAGRQLGLSDPRGRLFAEFVRLAAALRPRFILFENVAGLVTARGLEGRPGGTLQLVRESFEEIGFACRFGLLNAADFGAPQRRIRLFMIATADEVLPELPRPSHAQTPERSLFGSSKPWISLAQFFSTRPPPDDEDIVRPSPSRLAELTALRPGTGIRAVGIVEANRPSGHWGYRQDCFVADTALPSRTIRAATTPDWIKECDGQLRRLTWRECAALQGFPPEWRFAGGSASRFRQIGNAVQGSIAKAFGSLLSESAATRRTDRPRSAEWPPEFRKRIRYTESEHLVNGAHRKAAQKPRRAAV